MTIEEDCDIENTCKRNLEDEIGFRHNRGLQGWLTALHASKEQAMSDHLGISLFARVIVRSTPPTSEAKDDFRLTSGFPKYLHMYSPIQVHMQIVPIYVLI